MLGPIEGIGYVCGGFIPGGGIEVSGKVVAGGMLPGNVAERIVVGGIEFAGTTAFALSSTVGVAERSSIETLCLKLI